MKKKYIAWLLGVCAVLAAVIGATAAARFSSSTELAEETISEKDLGVAQGKEVVDNYVITPGEEVELGYFAVNTGGKSGGNQGNYDIYTMVTVYFDFLDKNDNAIDVDGKLTYKIKTNKGLETIKEGKHLGDWIVGYCDDEQMVMYYTKPLAYGESSTEYLSCVELSKSLDNKYIGTRLAVETEVNAVQTNNAAEAIPSEWGVYPEFDKNGNIVNISESKNEETVNEE